MLLVSFFLAAAALAGCVEKSAITDDLAQVAATTTCA
jgi:hypothetical protein